MVRILCASKYNARPKRKCAMAFFELSSSLWPADITNYRLYYTDSSNNAGAEGVFVSSHIYHLPYMLIQRRMFKSRNLFTTITVLTD